MCSIIKQNAKKSGQVDFNESNYSKVYINIQITYIYEYTLCINVLAFPFFTCGKEKEEKVVLL